MKSFFKTFSLLKINRALAWCIFGIYIAPVIFMGCDYEFRIHDQLDSYNVFAVLIDSGNAFSFSEHAKIDNIMNGLPRSCFPSGFNIIIWLIMLFGKDGGFLVNYIFVHLIGFLGTYFFLEKHANTDDKDGFNWLAALLFGILPVNALCGISLPGIPMVLYAFLNLTKNTRILISYGILLFYALYSSMIHAGVFVIATLFFIYVYKLYRKESSGHALAGLAFIVFCYCLIEMGLIRSILFSSDYLSHRIDFVPRVMLNWKGVLGMGILHMLKGNYASANYPGALIVCIAGVVFIYARIKGVNAKSLAYLIIAMAMVGIFISFWDWLALKEFYYQTKIFLSFNPRRAHFLLPVGALLLLVVSIRTALSIDPRLSHALVLVMLCLTTVVFYLNRTYNESGNTSYNQFFSRPLLKEIDDYINRPKSTYRVAHLGLEPTISQCYGFYTLDSYQNNYPHQYKLQFRKIVEKELEKAPEIKNYFDIWGNRCYLVAATSFEQGKKVIKHLDLNIPEFKKMGGEYIFSGARISNSEEIGLKFLKSFSHKSSNYVIYLYQAV